jgi:hypothetical protein
MVSDWLRPCEIVGRPQLVLLGSQGGPPTAPGSSRVTLALQPVEHVGGRPSQVAADLVRPGCFAGGAPLVDRGDRNGQVGRQVLIVQSGLDMRAPVSTGPGSGLAGRLTAPSPGRLLGLGATRAGRGRGVRGSPARPPACGPAPAAMSWAARTSRGGTTEGSSAGCPSSVTGRTGSDSELSGPRPTSTSTCTTAPTTPGGMAPTRTATHHGGPCPLPPSPGELRSRRRSRRAEPR